jgi:gamma-glutamyltranspeptidase
MDSGLITMADMAGYAARIEPALTYDYHGWTVGKPGPWSPQGAVALSFCAAGQPLYTGGGGSNKVLFVWRTEKP